MIVMIALFAALLDLLVSWLLEVELNGAALELNYVDELNDGAVEYGVVFVHRDSNRRPPPQ